MSKVLLVKQSHTRRLNRCAVGAGGSARKGPSPPRTWEAEESHGDGVTPWDYFLGTV